MRAGLADLPVVPKAGGESEKADADASAEAGQGPGSWRSSPSWPLQVQNTDSIHWRIRPREPKHGSRPCDRAAQRGPAIGHRLLELDSRKALVGDHRVPGKRRARASRVRPRARGRSPTRARRRSACRRPSRAGRGESPRSSASASDSSHRWRSRRTPSGGSSRATGAGNGGRVEQPQAVAEGGRNEGEVVDRPFDLGTEPAKALVVGGLLGQVGEQASEPVGGQGEELAVVGKPDEHLGDRQGDELGVGDPRRAACPSSLNRESSTNT